MAARCRRLHAAAAEGKMSNVVTGDVAASHCGLGHAVGVTRTLRQSSIQFKQLLQMSGSGPGGGKSYRDGLMARLHDAWCSGARFNVYPQSITAPGKNSLYAGGGASPSVSTPDGNSES